MVIDRILHCQWLNGSQSCQNLHGKAPKLGQSNFKSPSMIHFNSAREFGNNGHDPSAEEPKVGQSTRGYLEMITGGESHRGLKEHSTATGA